MILVNSQVASFPPAARAHTVVALPPSPLPATQRLARVVGMSLVGSQQPLGRAGWCARCRAALRTCTRARAPTATYTTHSRSTTLCIDPTCGKRGTRMSTPPWRRRKKPGNPLETPWCCFHRHCLSEGGGFTGQPDYPQGGCNSTSPNSSNALLVSFVQGGEVLPDQLRPRMAVRRRRVHLSNWAEGSSLSRMVSVLTNHRVWLPPKPSCAGYPTPTYRTYFPRN